MRTPATKRRAAGRRGERGLTLIEVLVSFFILFVVTLAVLQLLSMGYLVNLGSMTRTELMYKAEQMVETIRLQKFRVTSQGQTQTALELQCCPIGANTPQTTIVPGDTCNDFWGPGSTTYPSGANVIDANSRFQMSYQIDVKNAVTVEVKPYQPQAGRFLYLGPVANKVVVYVAQLP